MTDRVTNKKVVTIAASTCESEAVHINGFCRGALHIPSSWTAAGLAFKAAPAEGGTYNPVVDDAGARVQCVSVGPSRVHVLPKELRNVRYVRLHSVDGSLADVNQGAERSIELDLKS